MPKYEVHYTGRYDYEVVADSEWEAEEQIKELTRDSWHAVETEDGN